MNEEVEVAKAGGVLNDLMAEVEVTEANAR